MRWSGWRCRSGRTSAGLVPHRIPQTIAEDRQILIAIRDADPPKIDAADDPPPSISTLLSEKSLWVTTELGDNGNNRSIASQTCSALPRFVEIVFVNQPGIDPRSRRRKSNAMPAIERTVADRNGMERPQEIGQRVDHFVGTPRFGFEDLPCRPSRQARRQRPRRIGRYLVMH